MLVYCGIILSWEKKFQSMGYFPLLILLIIKFINCCESTMRPLKLCDTDKGTQNLATLGKDYYGNKYHCCHWEIVIN